MNRLIFKVEMRGLGPAAPDAWARASRARCVGLGLTRPPFEKRPAIRFPFACVFAPFENGAARKVSVFPRAGSGNHARYIPDQYSYRQTCKRRVAAGMHVGSCLVANTHRGARTHDHKVKGLALCRLS
jgi:hypothetical protein